MFLVGAFINKRARLLQSLVFFSLDRLEATNVKINVQLPTTNYSTKLLDRQRQTGSAFRIVQRVPPFSYSIFIVRYKTKQDQTIAFEFFSALCDFSKNFLSPKGPPSSFLIFYSKLKFQKAQRVSPLKFFGTMRPAQNSYFSIFLFFSKNPKGPPFYNFKKFELFEP